VVLVIPFNTRVRTVRDTARCGQLPFEQFAGNGRPCFFFLNCTFSQLYVSSGQPTYGFLF